MAERVTTMETDKKKTVVIKYAEGTDRNGIWKRDRANGAAPLGVLRWVGSGKADRVFPED